MLNNIGAIKREAHPFLYVFFKFPEENKSVISVLVINASDEKKDEGLGFILIFAAIACRTVGYCNKKNQQK